MKKMIVAVVVVCCMAISAVAQQKAQWVTITSANLKCWECKNRLEEYLSRANATMLDNGIIERKYNLLQGQIKVRFYPDRTNINAIKTAIANAGFDTDEVKATPDAYKTLPPACKRAEDGGGPQKGKPCHVEPQ